MAIFRKIHTSFWSDSFVQSLTPEQRYFFIYLLSNEKTKQCGIYDISKRQMCFDTGYNIDTVSKLLDFFINAEKVRYNHENSELAIRNWNKYNGSSSPKVQLCVDEELTKVKDTLLIEYVYGINRVGILDRNKNKNKNKNKKQNTVSPSANKIQKQPEQLLDSKGDTLLDHNGNPVRSLKGMVF